MKYFIKILKNINLEDLNKKLLVFAIISLLFRKGSFAIYHVPKPFELIISLIILLTFIDLILNRKFKEFYLSISRNIRILLISLFTSILLGWVVSLIKDIPTTFNMVLEFGSFVIAIIVFLLVIFYTRNDQVYLKRYFYALCVPVIYALCVIFPPTVNYFNLTNGVNFLGFTNNENIISKMLIIPTIFFIVATLFENKKTWLKLIYILVSSLLISLFFWVASRAALISLFAGAMFIWLIFSFYKFQWIKLFKNGLIVLFIILLGFLFSPNLVKKVAMGRILNFDKTQSYEYSNLKNVTLHEIIDESYLVTKIEGNKKIDNQIDDGKSLETRFEFWPVYIKYILNNPLGIGPNTHITLDYIYRGERIHLGPHNTYLQVWLWGGFVGLFCFLNLLILIFRKLKDQLNLNFNIINLTLLGVVFTIAFVINANDSLQLFLLWIILALSINYRAG